MRFARPLTSCLGLALGLLTACAHTADKAQLASGAMIPATEENVIHPMADPGWVMSPHATMEAYPSVTVSIMVTLGPPSRRLDTGAEMRSATMVLTMPKDEVFLSTQARHADVPLAGTASVSLPFTDPTYSQRLHALPMDETTRPTPEECFELFMEPAAGLTWADVSTHQDLRLVIRQDKS